VDIYTTLVAAAGEPDIANKILEEHTQPIDGVNNLEYWMGKTDENARNNYIYYYESSIKAIRYKQWKLHFETSENYYAPYVKRSSRSCLTFACTLSRASTA
jgi:arylsulfatase